MNIRITYINSEMRYETIKISLLALENNGYNSEPVFQT